MKLQVNTKMLIKASATVTRLSLRENSSGSAAPEQSS